MAKLRTLSDEEIKKHLHYELKFNRDRINNLEAEWIVSENIYQAVIGKAAEGGLDADGIIAEMFKKNIDAGSKPALNSTMLARAMFFFHSKMCITEPDVVCRPFRRDYDTKKAAELGQLWIEHIKEVTQLQEVVESGPYLNLTTKGNGVLYVGYNKNLGEIMNAPEGFDPTQDDFEMTGDIEIRSVSPRNFYIDSTALHFKDAKNVIEKFDLSVAEFQYTFERPEILDKLLQSNSSSNDAYRLDNMKKKSNNSVPVYLYWEKALPWNGMIGSHIIFVEIGEEPGDIEILHRGEHPYNHKQIPYAMVSDLDIAESPYGMSRSIQCAHHIDITNVFLSLIIENIEINGVPRVMAPEGSTDDGLTTADLAKVVHYNPASGGQIYHLKPTAITTDVWRFIDIISKEIDAIYGQGEFSKGEIPRELSSYAVQLGIEMDDKFRIRVFNKKKQFLKTVYTQALSLVQQYCKEPRKLQVAGIKNKYKYEYFDAQDLAGDYGVYVEYGKYMPIDPSARKQMVLEIINSGAYERAGGNPKKIFKVLLDGDMFDLTEIFENSKEIQNSEIVDLIDGEREVAVQPWHEHSAHMEALQDLFQDQFFEELPKEIKAKLWGHYTKHETLFAKQAAQAQGAGGGPQPPNGQMQQPQNVAGPEMGGQGMVPPEPGVPPQ